MRGAALLAVSAFLPLPALTFPAIAAETSPIGIRLTQSGKAAVEIADCGGGTLCGKIVWLKDPLNEAGKPKTDKFNPAPELRDQKLCGLLMVGNFQRRTATEYENGFIYNPEDGKTYSSVMELKPDDTLGVRGFVGIPLFGKSQTWTRLPADHPRCKA